MKTELLFQKMTLNHTLTLQNRMVMAPMTRSRADEFGVPSDLAIQYYQQRANAGLIITEGTAPSQNGKGYARTPGIYTEAHVAAWKKITEAVHHSGGKIFLQLMHVGRIAHPLNKDRGARTVAPSGVKANGTIYTDQKGPQEFVVPEELSVDEIAEVISEYKQATRNAFDAGFDGVEFHAASGYLPMQFLSSNTNQRQDQYGGSVANRIRFAIEALEAMSSVQGPDKIGIRIWPSNPFNDIHDEHPLETYTALLKKINVMNLAYLHVIRSPDPDFDAFKLAHEHYHGTKILNGGFNQDSAEQAIQSGITDLISFGTLYLSNPDLVERFRQRAAFNDIDASTFYAGGAKGYIDYPFLEKN